MKRTPIKRHGRKAAEWKKFRDAYAEECRGADGLIQTPTSREEEPDLHHIIGRNDRPDLYFDKSNLLWLNRNHHNEVHSGTTNLRRTSVESQQPAAGGKWRPTPLHQEPKGAELRRSRAVAAQEPAPPPQTV